MYRTPGGGPVQMYEDPEDSIVSWSSPFANYVYEPDPDIPNYWVAVRMKTAEELRSEEIAADSARKCKKTRRGKVSLAKAQRTALYRLRDSSGELLYVGISHAPLRRWPEHAKDKPWFSAVANFATEWFESREAAMDAERSAIRSERPLHNVLHNQEAA